MNKTVSDIVAKLVVGGVDIFREGETSKASCTSYTNDRDTCGRGNSKRNAPAGGKKFSGFLKRLACLGWTLKCARSFCVSEVKSKGQEGSEKSIANFRTATRARSGTMSEQESLSSALRPSKVVEASLDCIFKPAVWRERHDENNMNNVHKMLGAATKISYHLCERCSWRLKCIP